eukprot:8055077-Ditylum_brightwellii.AAC.1
MSFDTDGMTAITDNSANAHIFNKRSLFVGEILSMEPNTGVATIRGTDHWPQEIGEAEISWKGDEGVSHVYQFKNALYFPDLPVNIISVTSLAEQLNDNEGTM